jgi:hypothetical protein
MDTFEFTADRPPTEERHQWGIVRQLPNRDPETYEVLLREMAEGLAAGIAPWGYGIEPSSVQLFQSLPLPDWRPRLAVKVWARRAAPVMDGETLLVLLRAQLPTILAFNEA